MYENVSKPNLFYLSFFCQEPPAGVSVREGLHYNPYFPGGAIAMAQALIDGVVEYDDETESSQSQMAKDVSTYLAWAAEPEHDERKKMGLKWLAVLSVAVAGAAFFKRFKWNVLKNRKIEFY